MAKIQCEKNLKKQSSLLSTELVKLCTLMKKKQKYENRHFYWKSGVITT